MLIIYNAFLILSAFFWLPWMLIRARARKEQPNWSERAGSYEMPPGRNPKRIWVHAVSVGEVLAVLPILRQVKILLPDWEILLSVTTSSGHQTAREKGKGVVDHLVYFPIDLPRFTVRAIARVKPTVVAVMETELWMNFLWTAKEMQATTLLLNGRISDRNHSRSKWILPYYHGLFAYLDKCLMQGERDEDRIKSLGAKNVSVLGNCKFDQAVEGLAGDRWEWREKIGASPDDFVIVVGSTRGAKDEQIVLDGIHKAFPTLDGVIVVHAPRHLERVEELAARVKGTWGDVKLRSKGETGRFIILDTYGELAQVYSAADIAIVGGGFDKLGGQNIIQPLAHAVPVLHGPHMHNFRDVTEAADASGASLKTAGAEELAAALTSLRGDTQKRSSMGAAGRALVEANLGASQRYAQAIVDAAVAGWKELPPAKKKK